MTKRELDQYKGRLMTAIRTDVGVEEARTEYETARVIYYLESNRERILLANFERIATTLEELR